MVWASRAEPAEAKEPYSCRRVLTWLQARRGETLLDLACVEGHMLYCASQAGMQATGLEFSPEAAAMAQKSAAEAVVFIGAMEELPFDSEAFHYVTCLGTPVCLQNPEQDLKEIYRVLKPGGRVFLILPQATNDGHRDAGPEIVEGLQLTESARDYAAWEALALEVGYTIRLALPERYLNRRSRHLPSASWQKSNLLRRWLWRKLPWSCKTPFILVLEKPADR